MFCTALGFLLLTAITGTLLRTYGFWSVPLPNYGHLLHAHSHAGFLGWVFNAFFALSFLVWVPVQRQRGFLCLFALLQVGNVGMFVSFLAQGYGVVSIIFSTWHLVASVAFILALWREPTVDAAARPWLRCGLAFLLLSGLGPLALGPLAALDLRAHPAYELSIYWYLHFQYNGWFIFFLAACGVAGKIRANPKCRPHAWACPLLASGVVLTYGISALWLEPAAVVHWISLLGNVLQLTGALLLLRSWLPTHPWRWLTRPSIPKALIVLAVIAFLVKCLLQFGAVIPALTPLANNRFIVIAFLHLVFLLVVLPALIALAWKHGWIVRNRFSQLSLALLVFGILGLELSLVLPVLLPTLPGLEYLPHLFLITALIKTTGIAGLLLASIQASFPRIPATS